MEVTELTISPAIATLPSDFLLSFALRNTQTEARNVHVKVCQMLDVVYRKREIGKGDLGLLDTEVEVKPGENRVEIPINYPAYPSLGVSREEITNISLVSGACYLVELSDSSCSFHRSTHAFQTIEEAKELIRVLVS